MRSRIWVARAVLLASLAPALAGLARAQAPDIVVTRRDGAPYIDVSQTARACPEHPLDAGLRQRIINAAAQEWAAFGFPRFALTPLRRQNVIPPGLAADEKRTRTVNALVARVSPIGWMEDDAQVRARIGRYWASIPQPQADGVMAEQNQIWRATRGRAGWVEYWSAAFISYVMCRAGLTQTQFARDSTHIAYIRPAVAQRDGERKDYAYTAYDVAEARPEPGDLICAARNDEQHAIDDLRSFRASPKHGSYHCDIVVGFDQKGKKAAVLYAIGGNVINAVSLTETPIRNGTLKKVRSPHGRNWFAILKLQAGGDGDFRKVPRAVLDDAAAMAKQRQGP